MIEGLISSKSTEISLFVHPKYNLPSSLLRLKKGQLLPHTGTFIFTVPGMDPGSATGDL